MTAARAVTHSNKPGTCQGRRRTSNQQVYYRRFWEHAAFRSSYHCHCDVQLSPVRGMRYAVPAISLGGLLYGIHSHPIPCLEARGSHLVPSSQIVPSRPNTLQLDGHLFDREPHTEGGKGREHQTLIFFGRVEGWAGLEALGSHRPLCHHSHAKKTLCS